MRLQESPKSEGFEPQILDHIHALICSEIQQALGATSHYSPGADATSQSEELSSNQVPTVTSGTNPVPPNTVPIVSSSAGSVSSQLECHVCVRVCVCACEGAGVQKLQYKQALGYLLDQGRSVCACTEGSLHPPKAGLNINDMCVISQVPTDKEAACLCTRHGGGQILVHVQVLV